MTSHEHRGARRRPAVTSPLAKAELAAERLLGRRRRDEWRAQLATEEEVAKAGANEPAVASEPAPVQQARRERNGSGDFARGIARAELGRFYWSAEAEAELTAARKRRSERDGKRRK